MQLPDEFVAFAEKTSKFMFQQYIDILFALFGLLVSGFLSFIGLAALLQTPLQPVHPPLYICRLCRGTKIHIRILFSNTSPLGFVGERHFCLRPATTQPRCYTRRAEPKPCWHNCGPTSPAVFTTLMSPTLPTAILYRFFHTSPHSTSEALAAAVPLLTNFATSRQYHPDNYVLPCARDRRLQRNMMRGDCPGPTPNVEQKSSNNNNTILARNNCFKRSRIICVDANSFAGTPPS